MHRFHCNTGWKNLLCKKNILKYFFAEMLETKEVIILFVVWYMFVFQMER